MGSLPKKSSSVPVMDSSKALKTSASTGDKLSKSSSEIRILPTDAVGLGSVCAQSADAHNMVESTVAPEIKPAPNIDKEKTEVKVTSVLEAKLNVDTKPAVSTERLREAPNIYPRRDTSTTLRTSGALKSTNSLTSVSGS